jgi:hypothetical protein
MTTQWLSPVTDIEMPARRDFMIYEEANLEVQVQLWRNGTHLSYTVPTATTGAMILEFHSSKTAAIPVFADPAIVQAALEVLNTIGPGNIIVTANQIVSGSNTTQNYTFTWGGPLVLARQALIRVSSNTFSPAAAFATAPLIFPDSGENDHWYLQVRAAVGDPDPPLLELTSDTYDIYRSDDGSVTFWLDAGSAGINAPISWSKGVYDVLLVHNPDTNADRILTGNVTVVPAVTRLPLGGP